MNLNITVTPNRHGTARGLVCGQVFGCRGEIYMNTDRGYINLATGKLNELFSGRPVTLYSGELVLTERGQLEQGEQT